MADEPGVDSQSSTYYRPGGTIKQCEVMIQKGLQTPMVKFLLEQMEKSGCRIDPGFIKAVHCDRKIAGSFQRGKGINVCSNHMIVQDQVSQALAHELIHAYDDCRAANMNWRKAVHQACSEIRANHLTGDCSFKREFLRGNLKRAHYKIKGHEQECVRRRARESVAANHNEAVAKEAVEAVWDLCYNDTQPFEKAL